MDNLKKQKLDVVVEAGMTRTCVVRAASAPLAHSAMNSAVPDMSHLASSSLLAQAARSVAEDRNQSDTEDPTIPSVALEKTQVRPVATPVGRHDLSAKSVQEAHRNQFEVKSALTNIHRQSNSPAVVRMYSASIKADPNQHSLLGPISRPESRVHVRDRLTSPNPCKQKRIEKKKPLSVKQSGTAEAIKNSKLILAEIARRGQLPAVVVEERPATKLLIDNRPKPPGVIPSFEKRITSAGASLQEGEEVPLPFPKNPFVGYTLRDDPSLVYTPGGINDLLENCLPGRKANGNALTEDDQFAIGVVTNAGEDTRPGEYNPRAKVGKQSIRESNKEDSNPEKSPHRTLGSREKRSFRHQAEAVVDPRRLPPPPEVKAALASSEHISRSVTPSHTRQAEEAMRTSHKHGLAPTRSTLASRQRIVRVKAHLQWKKATQQSNSGSLETTFGTLNPEGSISMISHSVAAGVKDLLGAQQNKVLGNKPPQIVKTVGKSADTTKSHGMKGVGDDHNVIWEHRGGIVKAVHNR